MRQSRRHSRVTTALTLTVLVGVLAGMGYFGLRAATAPLPSLSEGSADVETCPPEALEVQRFVLRRQVQVSVFNAGTRSGQANRGLARLERAGFIGGNLGNAPDGVRVPRALVWTTEEDDTAAALVARVLGEGTEVEVVPEDLGPGVDVLLGNDFEDIDTDAPRRLELPEPIERCIDVDS